MVNMLTLYIVVGEIINKWTWLSSIYTESEIFVRGNSVLFCYVQMKSDYNEIYKPYSGTRRYVPSRQVENFVYGI